MNMNIAAAPRLLASPIHQQNFELFTFVLRCVAMGDSARLDSAGLSERDVAHLRSLSLAQLLALSDQGLRLSSYLDDARRRLEAEELSNALIEHRAPRQLMMQLFRVSTRRFAVLRTSRGVAGGRGRPSTNLNDSSLEHRIWRLWILLGDPTHPDRLLEAEYWLLVALEAPGHLRTAWSLIQRWAREPQSLLAFAGDRVRLGEKGLQSEEHELRERHRIALATALSRHPVSMKRAS